MLIIYIYMESILLGEEGICVYCLFAYLLVNGLDFICPIQTLELTFNIL